MRRILLLLLLLATVVPLTACVVEEVRPPGRPGAVWVPGHYYYGRWIAGHWA
jgi:hypothetical protein